MVVKFQNPFKARSSRGNLLLLLRSATGLDVQKYAGLPKLGVDVGDAKGHMLRVQAAFGFFIRLGFSCLPSFALQTH